MMLRWGALLFDFVSMKDYDARKVNRYEDGNLLVDTCAVSDSAQPYETAVAHPAYNDGMIVIVEMYDSIEEAKDGHLRWVKAMTASGLPHSLCDVSTAKIACRAMLFLKEH